MKNYFKKMKGGTKEQNSVSIFEVFWSALGAILGISLLHYVAFDYVTDLITESDIKYIIGSFGASAVLVYGIPDSPYSQPRNLVGGHILSAFVGVLCYQLLPTETWLIASIAVAGSLALMQLTHTLHPPGGATALIAVIGSSQIHEIGYMYVLLPVARGTVILLAVALIINNLSKKRCYPKFWI